MQKKFIQELDLKRGALKKQLDIPANRKIPFELLMKIQKAKAGETIRNPTATGKRTIKVTRLLEQRVILAMTLRKIKKKGK